MPVPSPGDEDDLDALLAKFALEEKATKAVTVVADCEPPSARVNASFVPHLTQVGEARGAACARVHWVQHAQPGRQAVITAAG